MMLNGKPTGEDMEHCQNYYPDFVDISHPDQRKALSARRIWWGLKKFIWHIQARGLIESIRKRPVPETAGSQRAKSPHSRGQVDDQYPFQPGDLVEVRSTKEIFVTLDAHDKCKGLQFTKEMSTFCGRTFRIMKRVDKILIETTGELRAFKFSTYILEDVYCNGKYHGACDRTCFIFWRGEWLKKAPERLT